MPELSSGGVHRRGCGTGTPGNTCGTPVEQPDLCQQSCCQTDGAGMLWDRMLWDCGVGMHCGMGMPVGLWGWNAVGLGSTGEKEPWLGVGPWIFRAGMLWDCGVGMLQDWAPQEGRSPGRGSTDTKKGGSGRYKLCFSGGAVTTAAGQGQHSALISTKAPLEPEPGVTATPAGSALAGMDSQQHREFFIQYPPAPLQRRVLHLVGSCG